MHQQIIFVIAAVLVVEGASGILIAAPATADVELASDAVNRKAVNTWPKATGAEFRTPRPPYPTKALEERLQGTVKLRVLFNSAGRVENIAVLESNCGQYLRDYTVDWATKEWRMIPGVGFKPGYHDLPITFKIQ